MFSTSPFLDTTDNSLSDDECQHIFSGTSGMCSKCGENMIVNSTFDSTVYWKEKKKKEIFSKYDFEKTVVTRAEEIYQEIKRTVKVKRREPLLMMIFSVLYYAHHELRFIFDPRDLAIKIGLSPNKVSAAITRFSPIYTGYRPKITMRSKKDTVFDLIRANGIKFNLSDDAIEDIISNVEEVWNKSDKLLKKESRTIVAGAINYYLKIHGYSCEIAVFSKTIGVSSATIIDSSKEIEKFLQ